MQNRALYQKITLLAMAGMMVVFGILTAFFQFRKGVYFEGALLYPEAVSPEETVYSGKAYHMPVTVSVVRADETLTTVEFTIGAVVHDVCQVEYPLPSIRTEYGGTVNGIRITKDGRVLFEGGYNPEEEFGWYKADGERDPLMGIDLRVYSSGDPWYGYETTARTIRAFAMGPALTARGSWSSYMLAAGLTLLAMLLARFSLELFLRRQSWYVENPQPTEFYFLMEKFGWALWVIALLFLYLYPFQIHE